MDFLGTSFVKNDGSTVGADALKGKVVGIYFSAHWCPPCRGFTPDLVKFYNTMQSQGKNFEIIFASSDRDQSSFDEYFATMPWLALPFGERALKEKFSKKFKVSGIPMFVVIDENGELITTEGRNEVSGDMNGAKFPWKPKPVAELLGERFTGKSGEVGKDAIAGKTIGIYFSAHWCPPCRGFTPDLVKSYNNLKAAGKNFEIIFASSDRDQSSFDEYYGEMPWLALPFDQRAEKEELAKRFGVQGIPMLVILDENLEVINDNARGSVSADPECAKFPWVPPPLKDLSEGADGLNEEMCLIAILDGCDDDDQDAAIKALEPLAQQYTDAAKAGSDAVFFFYTKGGDPVSPQIKKLCKLKNKSEAQVILLNIPADGAYYVADCSSGVTTENMSAFVKSCTDGTAERKQLERA
jgi:nucleoredoxin